MNRKEFLRGLVAAGAVGAAPFDRRVLQAREAGTRHPRAIAMWDFSWLERRWPGAGYEDWDGALDGLATRGYDAVRIDPYPHLVAAAAHKAWLLKPVWDTQDWGAPTLVRVQILPDLYTFIGKCRDRGIKVGLSTWFREDEDNVRLKTATPELHADIWIKTLEGIRDAGLLDTILYVDLCNEWPGPLWTPFLQPPLEWGAWPDPRAMHWMRTAIATVRAAFPNLPLLFSTNGKHTADYEDNDLRFIDAIEHHIWMASENDSEFYKRTGYAFERFSEEGYHKIQFAAAAIYAEKSTYWQNLLTDKIAALATAARRAKLPLMTTECWGIVDYKDWPLLPWEWVMDVCAVGVLAASATGQWCAIATSNFCGPQFQGMWRDVAWHQRLTHAIKSGPMDETLSTGRLWERL